MTSWRSSCSSRLRTSSRARRSRGTARQPTGAPGPARGPPTVADLDGQRPPDGDDRSAAVVARPSHRDPQAVGVGRAHSPGAHLQVTFEGIEPNRALRVVVGELGGGDRVTAGPGAVATVHGVKGSDT